MVLQIWFDEEPPNGVKLNIESCRDFLNFTKSNHIMICTSKTKPEWKILCGKWRDKFDEAFGAAGNWDEVRPQWLSPIHAPFPDLGRHAIDFLENERKPDGLLRAILNSVNQDFITNASEFKNEFSAITSHSKKVSIFDRYLLGCQHELFKINENGEIGYNYEFSDNSAFIELIRGLDLILNSIGENVELLKIYSEMLSWPKFYQSVKKEQLNSNLNEDLKIKEEWKEWHLRSKPALRKVAEHITGKLNPPNNNLIIEFWDCSTDSSYSEMFHDRFIQYSQGHHISSGGFRNVPKSITEHDLKEIDLAPNTLLVKVMLEDSLDIVGKSPTMVHKAKLKSVET